MGPNETLFRANLARLESGALDLEDEIAEMKTVRVELASGEDLRELVARWMDRAIRDSERRLVDLYRMRDEVRRALEAGGCDG